MFMEVFVQKFIVPSVLCWLHHLLVFIHMAAGIGSGVHVVWAPYWHLFWHSSWCWHWHLFSPIQRCPSCWCSCRCVLLSCRYLSCCCVGVRAGICLAVVLAFMWAFVLLLCWHLCRRLSCCHAGICHVCWCHVLVIYHVVGAHVTISTTVKLMVSHWFECVWHSPIMCMSWCVGVLAGVHLFVVSGAEVVLVCLSYYY